MNFTPLDDAFKIHHTNPNTYSGTIYYSPVCIFCLNPNSTSLMNDGGAFRQCNKCRKNFRATVLNQSINNFSYSTSQLKGTN
jgi:hypothetical protein